jgi:undecaprenyl-diphosphatase
VSLFQLVVLALVQGITEWLPISSSAHLILIPALTDMPDQGPLIDAMAHIGSLGAVLIYFWKDVGRILHGMLDLVVGRPNETGGRTRLTFDAKLFLFLVVATPPGLVAGALYAFYFEEALRSTTVIATTTIVYGIALWAADALRPHAKDVEHMTFKGAIFIGLAQALALVPGTSRSGITMTAARLLGFERNEAARFSMLVGIPLIAASGVFAFYELVTGGYSGAIADDGTLIPVTLTDGLIVAALSFGAAFASIATLMAILKRMSFLPFVLYRFALGAVLIWLTLQG